MKTFRIRRFAFCLGLPVWMAVGTIAASQAQNATVERQRDDVARMLLELPPVRFTGCTEAPPGPGGSGVQSKPLSYEDRLTNTVIYVESDGRHVSAIDSSGKILWTRNPFVDSQLCPYRTDHPIIVQIAPVTGEDANIAKAYKRAASHFVWIRFDSSQMGYLDVRTGDFLFGGHD